MRTSILICFLAVLTPLLFAQDELPVTFCPARINYPETAALRERIAAFDSSRSSLAITGHINDSVAQLVDSVRATERPWEAAPLLRSWTSRFPHETDSLLVVWVSTASMLNDTASSVHMADVQRSAVRVDSVRGIIDLVPLPAQRVYRVRSADSSVRLVQLDKPHKAGDTIAIYVAQFGRAIFMSRTVKPSWEMSEGSVPPVGADSVFDLLREVPRPRAYDVYERVATRFAALRLRLEQPLLAVLDSLSVHMRRDVEALNVRRESLERESRAATHELQLKNLMVRALHDDVAGKLLAAVPTLESLLKLDSSYPGAGDLLAKVRHHIDSTSRQEFFGENGRKNMELIPGGEIMLRSGERFRPDPFFLDRSPVSINHYTHFEAATGYHSRGAWHSQPTEIDTSDEPVHGVAAEDKVAFAQWAGGRPASPQEIEYAAAGGWTTLAMRKQHAATENFYHVTTSDDGFSCVRELRTLNEDERDRLTQQSRTSAKEIREKIEGIGLQK